MKIRPAIQWVIGITLAGAGMWIFLRSIDIRKLGEQIVHANPLVLVTVAALSIVAIWLRALRSMLLLPSCSVKQKKNLFPIAMVGFMVNNILPARMGEAARAVLLWKKNGYSGAVSVGSLVLERILDTLVFMACFFVPVFMIPGLSRSSASGGGAAGSLTLDVIALGFCAAFCAGVVVLVAYSRFPLVVRKGGKKLCASRLVPRRFASGLTRIAAELISNLDWVFSLKRAAGVAVLSFAIVSCYAVMTVLLINDKSYGFAKGLFSSAFAAIGAAIPLAPGYVGTMHAVFLQGLLLCGISREQAGAATIFFHAVPYVAVTLLGLYYYFRFQVKFKDISKASDHIDTREPGENLT
jgi:uncharacterized protein (TIRG00374 family)